MQIINTPIEGLKLIEPLKFEDNRGAFFESYNQDLFHKAGIQDTFVQDNQSISKYNVLRGVHFQKGKFAQAKLVRVIQGKVLDIVVDLRHGSKTFGQYFAVELSQANNFMLYIPIGFAHGFHTLEDNTIFAYKCSAPYNKTSEDGIIWNDKTLNINWGNIQNPIISEKDLILPNFNHEHIYF